MNKASEARLADGLAGLSPAGLLLPEAVPAADLDFSSVDEAVTASGMKAS